MSAAGMNEQNMEPWGQEHLIFKKKIFLATLHSTWDLSSPTMDRTCAPCSGSAESCPLGHQGIPRSTPH